MLNIYVVSSISLILALLMIKVIDESDYLIDTIFLLLLLLSIPIVILLILSISFGLLILDILRGK